MKFLVFILSLIGLVTFFSASYYYSLVNYNNPYYYFFRFFLRVFLLGLVAFFIGELIGRRFFKLRKFFLIMFFLLYFSIILGFIPSFRLIPEVARWFKIGPFTFQPSEIIKPFALATFVFSFSRLKNEPIFTKTAIFVFFLIFLVLPIYLQPALSNVLIILLSLSATFFALLKSTKEIFLSGTIIFLIILVLVGLSSLWSYRVERFIAFFTKGQIYGEKFYQVERAVFAVSSGGLFGKGIGNSEIKILGLPQMLTDSIFAIYAEELGFLGSLFLIVLYLILIITIILKGLKTKEKEKYAFSLGVATWLTIQTFLHLASNTGLFVPTGVILPFLSYGPSGQLAIYFSLGIIDGFKR